MVYLPGEKRFALAMNRFIWEKAETAGAETSSAAAPRSPSTGVKARRSNIDRNRPDAVLELLAASFEVEDSPAGKVTLIFAGGGAVQLDVEVVEARLADLGTAWATQAKPSHDLAADETKPGAR